MSKICKKRKKNMEICCCGCKKWRFYTRRNCFQQNSKIRWKKTVKKQRTQSFQNQKKAEGREGPWVEKVCWLAGPTWGPGQVFWSYTLLGTFDCHAAGFVSFLACVFSCSRLSFALFRHTSTPFSLLQLYHNNTTTQAELSIAEMPKNHSILFPSPSSSFYGP